MADVVVISYGNAVVAIDAGGSTPATVEHLVEQIAELAHAEVHFATIEVVAVDDFGPGDLADALTREDSDEVPVSSWFKKQAE